MAHNFGSLVFTPVVKALQERYGSRRQYARLEASAVSRDLSAQRNLGHCRTRHLLHGEYRGGRMALCSAPRRSERFSEGDRRPRLVSRASDPANSFRLRKPAVAAVGNDVTCHIQPFEERKLCQRLQPKMVLRSTTRIGAQGNRLYSAMAGPSVRMPGRPDDLS